MGNDLRTYRLCERLAAHASLDLVELCLQDEFLFALLLQSLDGGLEASHCLRALGFDAGEAVLGVLEVALR